MLRLLLAFILLSSPCYAQIYNPGGANASNINSGVLGSQYGGTGANNGSNTITLGGNLTTSGSNNITFTTSGSTNVSLPTTGTLGIGTITAVTTGTGLSGGGSSGSITVSSNAEQTMVFQPGLLSTIVNTKGNFIKFVKASTVDNIEISAITLTTCTTNPTVTVYECGTSTSCSGPTTIGSLTVTSAGTVVDGTVSSSAISAGDYVAFAISAGSCVAINLAATVQYHSN
jgi:hypothetical protein